MSYRLAFATLPWQAPARGIRYKAHEQDGVRVRLIEFEAGLDHPEWCVTGHTAYVLEGRLELRFDEHTEVYEPGDMLLIPDGEAHRHVPVPLTARVRLVSVESPLAAGAS